MFYSTTLDDTLRLGDVIKGIAHIHTIIEEPHVIIENPSNYKIDVENSGLLVILTPCCSIGPKYVALAPLIEIPSKYFMNNYFVEDFTRINSPISVRSGIPDSKFEELSVDEQKKILDARPSYTLYDYFIYAGNPLFLPYKKRKVETNCYMVDFKRNFYIESTKLKGNGGIIDSFEKIKLFQLTIESRKKLREKLSFYFARVPTEDEILP